MLHHGTLAYCPRTPSATVTPAVPTSDHSLRSRIFDSSAAASDHWGLTATIRGALTLKVIWVLLTVAALRIDWAGVICARVVWSRFLEAVSTSAKRNFFKNRTPTSARFGQGVRGTVGILFTPACREDGGKPYLHKLPSDLSGM